MITENVDSRERSAKSRLALFTVAAVFNFANALLVMWVINGCELDWGLLSDVAVLSGLFCLTDLVFYYWPYLLAIGRKAWHRHT